MDNLHNCSIFIALLCAFLISDTSSSPIHGTKGHRGCCRGHHKHHHKRAVDGQPQIADLPSKMSLDNPQVKLYAQKGIEKLVETSTGPTDPLLEKILDATFFDPAGKLLYEIKIKVESKKTKDSSQQCTVNVWRESNAEPSVTVECPQARRRRADDGEPQIADLPTTLNIDDPKVKKYAQIALDKIGGHSSGTKGIVREIVEAKSYPPSGKILYTVKLKIGSTKCPKGSNEKNCEYDPEAGDDNCEISVFKETDEEDSTGIQCWRVDRRRRASDGQIEIADLPTKLSIDDPEVKKFAQEAADKFGSPLYQDKKAIVMEIKEATSYPPAGKLLYKIKMRLGTTNCAKGSVESNCEYNSEDETANCEVDILRETNAEHTLSMVCSSVLRRRRDTEKALKILNLPKNVSIDDPEVRKYAQNAVDRFGTPIAQDKKAILREIKQAVLYSRGGKNSYMIQMRVGVTQCAMGSEETNCKHNPEEDDVDCKLYITTEKATDKEPSQAIECTRAAREKRAVDRRRESVQTSVDDPVVKKYAEEGIEKLVNTSTGPSDPFLEKILEARLYPYAEKLLTEVEMIVGSKENKDKSEECIVFVWRNGDAEPNITVKCGLTRRRRTADDNDEDDADEDRVGPLILDKPLQVSIDDPEVKKYAQKGVEIYAESSTGPNEPILEKIEEALLFPPVGTILFEIKIKIGMSTCAKGQKENCELNKDGESQSCTVNVFIENEKPRVELKCN